MVTKLERPVCLGTIINGEPPEACKACTLHQLAENVTAMYTTTDEGAEEAPDVVDQLGNIYKISQDPTDKRRTLAREALTNISNSIIAQMVEERKTLVECPNYRRSLPENP